MSTFLPPPSSVDDTTRRADLAAAVREVADDVLAWVDLRRRMLRTPGVQICVRVGDQVLVDGASGVADSERGTPLTTSHLFRIASHSKTFAATAVMMLAERGELRLDDTVGERVPDLAGTPLADRTVRELLGHQAGVVRDGADCDYWQLMRPFPDRARLITDLVDHGATFERNEHFKYSNYGYAIAGLVVEEVTGVRFGDFVRKEILAPLGLDRVHADVDDVDPSELASGHSLLLDGDDTHFVLASPSTGAMAPATGFTACARDLSAYAAAHALGVDELLSDPSKRLMQRLESRVMTGETETGRYGLGLELHTIGERSLVGHSGGFPGFVTRTFVDPADGLVVSVLTNASRGPAHELAVGVLKLIDLALRARSAPSAPAPEGVDLDGFATSVVAGFGRISVLRLGDRLVLMHPDQEDPTAESVELEIEGPDRLRIPARPGYGSAGESVEYDRDEHGVRSLRVGGMSAWPESVFRERRREQMAAR
ncbi:serine hydrolase domain-containing protein [Nocardioides flavescens]|uniref:Serine hydrolase n=1 Tax=Nocardioides flavescens TaxID=2691959 RepID=A0A6L7F0H8_9ACTN|nr:serine hydrolase domain-containing protein [Nocardioides flavescens]MXG89562.1 serine hydrolase [Nocardioides flavescens]